MTTKARRRRQVLVVGGALLMLALVVTALAGRAALQAARDLEGARAVLEQARATDQDVEAAGEAVGRAQALIASAQDRLASPAVSAVAGLPVVGRSLDVERAVARAAGSALAGVTMALDAAPDLRRGGGVDAEALAALGDRLAPVAAQAESDFSALRATPTGLTPPQVGRAAEQAARALEPVVDGLQRGAVGAEVVAGILGAEGPRRVLVALENNAELRGTGGYVSTFAVGRLADGRVELQPFRDVFGLSDSPDEARRVPAPPEFVEDYGSFLADTTLWREWNMTPDVPDAAAVTAEVAQVLLGEKPDVVVLLDVPALAAVVGLADHDVVLPGGVTVAPEQLTEALLVDTYSAAGTANVDQTARRAQLRAAAGATAARLLTDGVSPLAVVEELGRLARGRHLAVWSARPREQAALERLGVAGSADPGDDDLALVSVNNINANKLDYYVDRTVSVEATVGRRSAEVVQRVVLRNRAPQDLVPYVAGEQTPGTVRGRVELSLSPRAQFLSLRKDGAPTTGDVRQGAERQRVHTFVTLARDQQVEIEVRYVVPLVDGHYRLRLIPQALARDAELTVALRPEQDAALRVVGGAELVDGAAVRTGPWAEEEIIDVMVVPVADSRADGAADRGGPGTQ